MNWEKPNCIFCKKPIEKAKEALYQPTLLKGDTFCHVGCYAQSIGNVVGNKTISGVVTNAPLLTGNIIGAVGIQNTFKDLSDEAKRGKQKELQARMTKTLYYAIFASIVAPIGIYLFINNKNLEALKHIDLIAGLFITVPFVLVALYTLYYHIKLKEFEKLFLA